MSGNIRLDWEHLVSQVRHGTFEPTDNDGHPFFLYSRVRNVFVSDPYLLKQIVHARLHGHPFMLIGQFGTGKNIFLELVADAGPGENGVECIDENVNGSQDEMLDKFFGPGGVVEQHPSSLLHFDLRHSVRRPLDQAVIREFRGRPKLHDCRSIVVGGWFVMA
jgi:hypothetical protein